jgi:hypothetical protein
MDFAARWICWIYVLCQFESRAKPRGNVGFLLDFAAVEHTFACGRLPKIPVDQVCHFHMFDRDVFDPSLGEILCLSHRSDDGVEVLGQIG